jgi:hypothetical protein
MGERVDALARLDTPAAAISVVRSRRAYFSTSAARCCSHLSDVRGVFYDLKRIWTEGWPATA